MEFNHSLTFFQIIILCIFHLILTLQLLLIVSKILQMDDVKVLLFFIKE